MLNSMISIQCWLDMIDQSIAVWIQKNRARPEAMQDSICACAPRMTPACFQFQTGDIQHVRIESTGSTMASNNPGGGRGHGHTGMYRAGGRDVVCHSRRRWLKVRRIIMSMIALLPSCIKKETARSPVEYVTLNLI